MSDSASHQNEVKLEEETQIILSIYHGDQTSESIRDAIDAAKPLTVKLRTIGKPVHILIDTSDIRSQDSGARKAALDGLESLDYDKLCIFGGQTIIKYITQFLIQVSSKKDKVRYFDTEKDARDWLKS